MLFSARDLDILKLLRWCRFIRGDALTQTFSEIEISNLQALSLIKLHRASGAYLLTAKGNRFLDEAIPELPAATPPAYKAADTIRRLHLSEIMLTAYSSGLDPFALLPLDFFGLFKRRLYIIVLRVGRDDPFFWRPEFLLLCF